MLSISFQVGSSCRQCHKREDLIVDFSECWTSMHFPCGMDVGVQGHFHTALRVGTGLGWDTTPSSYTMQRAPLRSTSTFFLPVTAARMMYFSRRSRVGSTQSNTAFILFCGGVWPIRSSCSY